MAEHWLWRVSGALVQAARREELSIACVAIPPWLALALTADGFAHAVPTTRLATAACAEASAQSERRVLTKAIVADIRQDADSCHDVARESLADGPEAWMLPHG